MIIRAIATEYPSIIYFLTFFTHEILSCAFREVLSLSNSLVGLSIGCSYRGSDGRLTGVGFGWAILHNWYPAWTKLHVLIASSTFVTPSGFCWRKKNIKLHYRSRTTFLPNHVMLEQIIELPNLEPEWFKILELQYEILLLLIIIFQLAENRSQYNSSYLINLAWLLFTIGCVKTYTYGLLVKFPIFLRTYLQG